MDTGTDRGTDTGTDVGTGMGTDTGTDVGIDTGTDMGTNTRIDTGTDVGTAMGTNRRTDTGTDVGTGVGIDMGRHTGTDMGTNTRLDRGTDVGTDIGTDTRSDVGTDRRTDMGTDVGTGMGTGVGTDAGTAVGPGTVPAAGEAHRHSAAGQEGTEPAWGWLLPSDDAARGYQHAEEASPLPSGAAPRDRGWGRGWGGAHAAGHPTGSLGGIARTRVLMHLVPSEHSAGGFGGSHGTGLLLGRLVWFGLGTAAPHSTHRVGGDPAVRVCPVPPRPARAGARLTALHGHCNAAGGTQVMHGHCTLHRALHKPLDTAQTLA